MRDGELREFGVHSALAAATAATSASTAHSAAATTAEAAATAISISVAAATAHRFAHFLARVVALIFVERPSASEARVTADLGDAVLGRGCGLIGWSGAGLRTVRSLGRGAGRREDDAEEQEREDGDPGAYDEG